MAELKLVPSDIEFDLDDAVVADFDEEILTALRDDVQPALQKHPNITNSVMLEEDIGPRKSEGVELHMYYYYVVLYD